MAGYVVADEAGWLPMDPVPDAWDTSRCGPPGRRCESCGDDVPDNAIVVVATEFGAICLTACPRCAHALRGGAMPSISLSTAYRLAAQHARHLRMP